MTDVAVVGSGPNGLAAAAVLARAGLTVEVFEAADQAGGGLRSTRLFDSDVIHDVCSAVHPMAAASRFFREFDLAGRGVEMVRPAISYAHPLPHARTGLAYPSLTDTCEALGADGPRWQAFMAPLVARSRTVVDLVLSDQRHLAWGGLLSNPAAPLTVAARVAEHAFAAGKRFGEPTAAAMLAGVAAHCMGVHPSIPGAAIAVLLGHLAHKSGWPLARGGSQRIADALIADIEASGGTVHTSTPVNDLRELTPARAIILDMAPPGVLRIAGSLLPSSYRHSLERFRYASGACKVDFLVTEPIPWSDPAVGRAGTVHLGGDQKEVFAAVSAAASATLPRRPFTLVSESANTDPSRGVPGKLPVWSYCHVPNGSEADMGEAVQARIEQHAPGFGETVLQRHCTPASELDGGYSNYVGGDIGAGAMTIAQSLFRPAPRWTPHSTPLPGVYLCSASTLPGPGVHGMAGYHAARAALRHEFGVHEMPDLAART